jgi:MinD-like ATPase involved in chromosome partitioning or flagellar assembly
LALNLAVEIARLGRRVCVFDADTNLANLNVMSGLNPEYTLADYLNGEVELSQLLLTGPAGITLVPAASGISDLVHFSATQQARLVHAVAQLEQAYELILIDTSAGINPTVLSFMQAANELIVGITAEPTSLTDAFSLLKVQHAELTSQKVHVIVNRVTDAAQAKTIVTRFGRALKKYLGLTTHALGYVVDDRNMTRAIMAQKPLCEAYPHSAASRCIHHIAGTLVRFDQARRKNGLSHWIEQQLVEVERADLQSTQRQDHLSIILELIRYAPLSQAQDMIEQIARHWTHRMERQQRETTADTRALKSAIRFAARLGQTPAGTVTAGIRDDSN